MKLAIITPVWGERCIKLFTGPVLDSHADALDLYIGEARYIVHTDQPEIVTAAIRRKTGCDVECHPLPQAHGYDVFVKASREAINAAHEGETLIIANADIIVSRETFYTVNVLMSQGRKAIMCAGSRTLPRNGIPRRMRADELLRWSMENVHPLIEDSFYPTGRTSVPSTIYFRSGDSIAMRGFHLHPLAVLKDRALGYDSTPDWNLVENFAREEIYVVTGTDELAVAEISPADKTCGAQLTTPFTAAHVSRWAARAATDLHWWLFGHRIAITGNGEFDDQGLFNEASRLRVIDVYVERPPRRKPLTARGRYADLRI